MLVNPLSSSQYRPVFHGGMGVLNTEAQQMILKSCSAKQLEEIKNIFQRQVNDKVFCFIYPSENKKWLHARIMCTHFINNFKEYYKQIPIFESKFGFIKRMSKQMDKYRTILENAQKQV